MMTTLRARKVYRQTHALFISERGLPPVASVSSVNDLEALEEGQGIRVTQISYQELGKELDRIRADETQKEAARQLADELRKGAKATLLDQDYVIRSVEFYQTIRSLMARHGCNAFTIECFEFCSSRLPEKWKITPCLVHTLMKDQGFASSCEADFPALLAMRLLMSVSQKSSHLGNMFLRDGDILGINHSAPGIRMNGYEEPGLAYKLGRFTQSGWGTKVIVDFTQNLEKRVTVVRVDPTASKLLVLEGELVGSDGWEGDNLGCSVEAQIRPMKGTSQEYARKQLDYGNHLVWVYGHYADELKRLANVLGMEMDLIG
jgi:L-fucose isomerase-like protein